MKLLFNDCSSPSAVINSRKTSSYNIHAIALGDTPVNQHRDSFLPILNDGSVAILNKVHTWFLQIIFEQLSVGLYLVWVCTPLRLLVAARLKQHEQLVKQVTQPFGFNIQHLLTIFSRVRP